MAKENHANWLCKYNGHFYLGGAELENNAKAKLCKQFRRNYSHSKIMSERARCTRNISDKWKFHQRSLLCSLIWTYQAKMISRCIFSRTQHCFIGWTKFHTNRIFYIKIFSMHCNKLERKIAIILASLMLSGRRKIKSLIFRKNLLIHCAPRPLPRWRPGTGYHLLSIGAVEHFFQLVSHSFFRRFFAHFAMWSQLLGAITTATTLHYTTPYNWLLLQILALFVPMVHFKIFPRIFAFHNNEKYLFEFNSFMIRILCLIFSPRIFMQFISIFVRIFRKQFTQVFLCVYFTTCSTYEQHKCFFQHFWMGGACIMWVRKKIDLILPISCPSTCAVSAHHRSKLHLE